MPYILTELNRQGLIHFNRLAYGFQKGKKNIFVHFFPQYSLFLWKKYNSFKCIIS